MKTFKLMRSIAPDRERFPITFPKLLSRKLDGIRALISRQGAFSREGQPHYNCDHILSALAPVFAVPAGFSATVNSWGTPTGPDVGPVWVQPGTYAITSNALIGTVPIAPIPDEVDVSQRSSEMPQTNGP